jgi:hypothetical protein
MITWEEFKNLIDKELERKHISKRKRIYQIYVILDDSVENIKVEYKNDCGLLIDSLELFKYKRRG